MTGIFGLGGTKPNQLRSGERKSGDDEDGTEAFEAVVECTGVTPVSASDVIMLRTTTDIDDNGKYSQEKVSLGMKR